MFKKIKNYIAKSLDLTPSSEAFQELMSADTFLYPHSPPSPYNPDSLVIRKGGLVIYDKMKRDDAIRACLGLKKYAVLSSGWRIESAVGEDKDREGNKEVADFVKRNLDLMEGTFDDVLLQMMTSFEYGFSVTEKIFGVENSKVILKALKTRKPHGITFETDKFGNLLEDGVIQAASDRFPAKKFVICTHNPEFDNWYGESDLRSCYRAWWSKDNIIKFWNMYLERYSMPPVVGKIKSLLTTEMSDVIKLQNILKRLQSASSAVIPESVEVSFLETKGKGAVSYKDAVAKHDMAIARALLVPNLLGLSAQGDTGSYSQSKTHFNVFLWIILRLRRALEELINEDLIRELVDYNFRVSEYPKFKFSPLDDDRKTEMAKLWVEAVSKGTLVPDTEDENLLRRILGWPEKEIEEEENGGNGARAQSSVEESVEKEERFTINVGRELTTYEKRVDFKKIEENLDILESEGRDRIVEILKKQLEVLQSFLQKKFLRGEFTPKLVNTLQLKYLRDLQSVIREMLQEAYRLGQKQVGKEIRRRGYTRIPPAYAIDWLTDKSFYIKGVLESSILAQVKGVLLSSLQTGEAIKETILKVESIYQPYIGTEMIADIKQAMPHRIETMIRTNTTGAVNNGRVAMSYDKDLKDYIVAFQFSAVLDDRTTEQCEELDGEIIRKDDPDFDRFVPPMHFNCFIDGQVPIYTSKGWTPIGDIELGDLILTHKGKFKPAIFIHHKQNPIKYNGKVVKIFIDVKKRSGKGFVSRKRFITVTPDHPVLTSRGWIKAGEIQKGDNLIVSAFKCEICGTISPWLGSEIPKYCSKSCAIENNDIINWSEERKKKQSKMTTKQLYKEYKNGTRNGAEITKQAHIRIDVAVPKHKINFEFDGSYWHSKLRAKRKDKERDRGLIKEGWAVVRYSDIVPSKQEIHNEISRIMLNHNNKYLFTKIEVVDIKRWKLNKLRRLYNISVKDDESYIAKGFVVHNCRSILIPVTTDDKPFKTITRKSADKALTATPEEFGGRIGKDVVAKKVPEEVVKRAELGEIVPSSGVTAKQIEEQYGKSYDAYLKNKISSAKLKKDVAGRLGTRMHKLKSKEWENLARAMSYGEGPVDLETSKEAASSILGLWAVSSGDKIPKSIAFQLAARKEFNLKGASVWWERESIDKASMFLKKHEVAMRRFLREMYNDTQEFLAKKGFKSVRVVRGYRGSVGIEPSTRKNRIAKVPVKLQPISSFTSNFKTAREFADPFAIATKENALIYAEVPASRVLSCSMTGFGCKYEMEWVVLGSQKVRKEMMFVSKLGKWKELLPSWSDIFSSVEEEMRREVAEAIAKMVR